MGVDNRKRRAAKKRAQGRRAPTGAAHGAQAPLTGLQVRAYLLEVLDEVTRDAARAGDLAALLLDPPRPLTVEIVRAGVQGLLSEFVSGALAGGWAPSDLAEITARRLTAAHVPVVLGLVQAAAARHAVAHVAPVWTQDLVAAGPAEPPVLAHRSGLQGALEIAALLARLPAITPVLPALGSAPAPTATGPDRDGKVLARVRALLAKAEASEFPEEAEALSAKAQELMTRHALDRLLVQESSPGAGAAPVPRRLWLEPPYVFAKAMLVHVVAEANRCRSITTEDLGFCTLVGRPDDLAVVELLVPSLLLQAHAAMLRCGTQTDRRGTSRTRSFRQSFLLSYAQRIGERLSTAAEQVTDQVGATPPGGQLVPVLRRQRELLDRTCAELFPSVTSKAGSVGNPYGWAAGRAAADCALLGADLQVEAAG